MAEKKAAFAGMRPRVSPTAATPASSGIRNQAAEECKPRGRRALWLSLATGVVGLGVIGGALAMRDAFGRMTPMTQQQRTAFERSLACVRQNVASPEKARFSIPGEGETWASDLGNGVFISRGTVAAPNGAGAMIRQEWQVAYDAAASRVLYLRVGDQRSGDINDAVAAAKVPASQRL